MCCFSQPTEVRGTSIFARKTAPTRQALVYQMEYAAKSPTAMILPLPLALPATERAVSWTDLKAYPQFFSDLASGYPQEESHGLFERSAKSAAPPPQAPLEVHAVGDFVASLVPTMNDFDRLDPRFAIKKDVWSAIPEYVDYGFAVFQLERLGGTPHPIAFEFESRLPDALYLPTVHIHDGTVHAQDQFDHTLYVQDAILDDHAGAYEGPSDVDSHTGFVRSKEAASSFVAVDRAAGLVHPGQLLHKKTLVGMLPNKDTFVPLKGGAANGGCGRCAAGGPSVPTRLGPASAALTAFAWIVRRRDRLGKR